MDIFDNYVRSGRGLRPVFSDGRHASGCFRVETRLSISDRDAPSMTPLNEDGKSFRRWGRYRDPGETSEDIL